MMWTTIQLGSREHYAIPKALHKGGDLEGLITDTWLTRGQSALARRWFPSLAARRASALPDSIVKHRVLGRLAIDASMRLGGIGGWNAILRRNEWFQKWAAREVARSEARTVFSYSYTARLPFAAAKKRGATCILGQIDPGPREVEVVREKTAAYRDLALTEENLPSEYWRLWREEIELADKVVVNSPWSARLLVEAGVSAAKLVEIPLVYECGGSMEHGAWSMEGEEPGAVASPAQAKGAERKEPSKRLKALFLGSVILRKGVGQLFDAIRMLKNESVDFTFAGPIGIKIPDDVLRMPNVRFLGPVDKATTEKLYKTSDIFLFPTISDGFGLTQLEALGHGLPVIASMHCGQVVEDCLNGLVLQEVTPEGIAEAIIMLTRDAVLLDKIRAGAATSKRFGISQLGNALVNLAST
jgi:glycosyltransferase involved in cell wall biosynthesis